MGSKPFQFKNFSVAQDRCTHKVGTDGVLLGAWVNITGTEKWILDVGTGTGLIAMMLAQRAGAEVHIDALDIEAHEVAQAIENVNASPWPEKISVHESSLQSFDTTQQYDLIISNPPFFSNSLLPPDEKRSRARHTRDLSFEDLIHHSLRLLTPPGRLALILPWSEGLTFLQAAERLGLSVAREATFRSRIHKPPERLLLELSRIKAIRQSGEITLYDGEKWSDAYRTLTRDFYLKD